MGRSGERCGMRGSKRRFFQPIPVSSIVMREFMRLSNISRSRIFSHATELPLARHSMIEIATACCRNAALPSPTACALSGLRQPGLGQPIDNALKVARLLVWEHTRALGERELGVDLEQLRPCQSRLLQSSEMAVACREQHAACVGIGI